MANNAPIFSRIPEAGWATLTTANTAKDGTGTVGTIFTADATNGSFVQRVIVRPLGSNTASVLRIFLNNGLTNATPANNTLIAEVGLATTLITEIAAIAGSEVAFNIPIPPGYRLMITLGTTVAGGYAVTAIGGDY